MLRYALPLLVALPLSVSAKSQMTIYVHSSKWVLNSTSYEPRTDAPPGVVCRNIFGSVLGRGQAKASSTGTFAHGSGYAWDVSLGCDISVAAAATGLVNRSFRYIVGSVNPGGPSTPGGPTPKPGGGGTGSSQGEVELWGRVEAAGFANLKDADCAAAALGYAEFKTNITSPIYAPLHDSVAATGSYSFGSLQAAYSGLGVGINVNVGTGTGHYPDQEQDEIGHADCVNYYFVQHRSRAYIKAWANIGLIGIGASANCRMAARVTSESHLLDCPH
ncbi:MAG: hypothetical protein VYE77_07625 [Planctomycetota bacterium]|nr:hypothetical protein [Planctomycetota bacterium]